MKHLAPDDLGNYRRARYRGDDTALTLAMFPDGERTMIASLYETLGALHATVAGDGVLDARTRTGFRDDLLALLRGGGAGRVLFDGLSDAAAEALHDVRGGALTALLLALGEIPDSSRRGIARPVIAALARDHRKIIRSVVRDVDPPGRARDAAINPHSFDDLAAAIGRFDGTLRERTLTIQVHREVNAIVAESCLEFAALERALFNLVNNAARHAETGQVDVWLLPVREHARVAVVNRVTDEQAKKLAAALADDAGILFKDFTTTGSGLGLPIVAEIVGNAYGLPEVDELVTAGYVGTRIIDGSFVSWFHWPLSMTGDDEQAGSFHDDAATTPRR